jgi:oligosaccharide repeat unit polymerase
MFGPQANREASQRDGFVPRLFAVPINPGRAVAYAAYCMGLLLTFPIAAMQLASADFLLALVLAYALGALVPVSIVFGTRLDLVEPLLWFSAMYYLVFPSTVYFLVTGFSTSEYLLFPGREPLRQFVEQAVALFLMGYASFLAGYLVLMRNRGPRIVSYPSFRRFSGSIARVVICLCVLIGAANFLYVAGQYPGGILKYLFDFGQRMQRYEQIEGRVTTIGYQFLYAGMLVWFLVLRRERAMRKQTLELVPFTFLAVFSVVVSISQGRMSQTVAYVLILGFLTYVSSTGSTRNLKFALFGAAGMFLGLSLYVLRRFSVAAYGSPEALTASGLGQYVGAFWPALGYWLVDKGNVPNIAILVNLLEQDGIAGELLHGYSLVAWVTGMSGLIGGEPNIARTIGAMWFSRDGGLPPTIVGEMFVNFGYLGVPVGMFASGVMVSWFYQLVRSKGDFIWYIVYLSVLFKFIFLWPKGEMSNLVGAVWQFLPALFLFASIRALSGLQITVRRNECKREGNARRRWM